MTIAVRNRIILASFVLVVLITAIFLLSIAFLFRTIPSPKAELPDQSAIAQLALAILCELLFCVAAVIILYFSFRKTASAEIFLFILFLVSMSFDSLKTLHILFEATVVPPYFGTIITRAIYFGRFFGILTLFGSGLFANGMQYERLEIVLVAGFLLAFTLAASIPVDMTCMESNFVMSTMFTRELSIIATAFYLFSLANFVLAAFLSGNLTYLLAGAGMAMVIVGRELLYFRNDALSLIVAFVLLISGTTLFGERTHEVRLWS